MNLFNLFGKSKGLGFGRMYVSRGTEERIKKDWVVVNDLLGQKSPSQLRQALMTADRTLDDALRDIVMGETMGERLKNSRDRFDPSTYNKIWEAHKVRNSLVHEAGYEPPHFIITEAIKSLQDGLKSLGIKI